MQSGMELQGACCGERKACALLVFEMASLKSPVK